MSLTNRGEQKQVYLLAGALGSGKTTFLNQMLEHLAPPVALVENEIGDINIDQETLKTSDDLLIEMNNGCLCCSVRGDLIVSLRKLLDSQKEFSSLIIESTGMADPGPIKEAFLVDPVLKEYYELKGVITIVDTFHFDKIFNESEQEYKQTFESQLIFADAFYFSKTDLLRSKDSLNSILNQVESYNGFAKNLERAEDVLNIKGLSLEEISDKIVKRNHSHSLIKPLSVEFPGVINHSLLEMFLSTLVTRYRGSLYRGKGVIVIKGQTHKVVFQNVYESFDFQLAREWPKELEEEQRLNQFVFIGKNLNKDLIEKGLKQCLLDNDSF